MDQIKIALCGAPGAGKSTVAQMMRECCEPDNVVFSLIKLADPLYEIQSHVYQLAGRRLDKFYRKDGELLDFLGRHMRRINPAILHERVLSRLEELGRSSGGPARLIVCDDARAPDVEFMRSLGFLIVRIDAPERVCAVRCRSRGDLSVSAPRSVTECGLDKVEPDCIVDNSQSERTLQQQVTNLVHGLVSAAA